MVCGKYGWVLGSRDIGVVLVFKIYIFQVGTFGLIHWRGCKRHSFWNNSKIPFVWHIWDFLSVCGDNMRKRYYRAQLVKDGIIFIFRTHKGKARPRCNQLIIMLVGDLLPLDPRDYGILRHATHPHVWVNIG